MRDLFKLVKWLLKILFRIVRGLLGPKFGFEEKPKPLKFNGKVVTDKDLQVLNKVFAKDQSSAYYKTYTFSHADVPTFEALDEHYAKDKNRAYYCDEYREGQNYYLTKKQRIVTIHDADTATFVSLDNGYAKDQHKAYFKSIAFEVKQVSSLVSINTNFAKDDISAYLNQLPVAGSDGKTFELLEAYFARDAANVYYYGYHRDEGAEVRILPCHRESFQILDYRYSKDDTRVFFLSAVIVGADPGSFEILTEEYSRDKNRVYYEDRKVTDADPQTFRVYPHDFGDADSEDTIQKFHSGKKVKSR
jgi:hypothetical protein